MFPLFLLAILLVGLGMKKETITGTVERYAPHSHEAITLFREAAKLANVPRDWAESPALHTILAKESDGIVGRPNYTYGARANDAARWPEIFIELRHGKKTAKSSATGLGQLILANVDAFYPSGRLGIGVALQEAAGMLRYIKARYGTPAEALAQYGKNHEGY